MTRTVSITEEDGGKFGIEVDDTPIAAALDDFDQALKIASLVIRAELGDDPEAVAELERLGVEPPVLEPDTDPLPQ